MRVCVCVCVCMREREKECERKEQEGLCQSLNVLGDKKQLDVMGH